MSASAIFTPPTSRAFSSAAFSSTIRSGDDRKDAVIMGNDSSRYLASNARYMQLCRMSDDIADDMHKEALAGVPPAFEYGCGLK